MAEENANAGAQQPPKKNRDRYIERMRGKYPDRNFDDDEALFEQTNADYDDYENQLNGYRDRESAFSNMFTGDPRSARLIMDWKDGQDPAIGLIRLYGNDIREALDDPDKQEELAQANKEYMERVAKEKDYEEQYQQNLEQTKSMIDQLVQNGQYTDEDIDNAMETIMTIVKDAILGKFSEDTISLALKARNHDVDVATAGDEGEVRGRNAKISEQLKRSQRNDGTVNLAGKNGQTKEQNREKDIFDIAAMA